MNATDLIWTNEADEDWADGFVLEAARLPAVRRADILAWLDEVHTAVGDSGVRAEELYGTPDESAAQLAANLPPERRAALDVEGMSPRDAIDGNLMTLGLLTVGIAVWRLATDGWSVDVMPSGLAVFIAVPLGTSGLIAALFWRRSGRLRLAALLAAATIAAMAVVFGVLYSTLDADRVLFAMPTAVLGAVGVVLAIIGWNMPTREIVINDRSRSWPADEWYRRLNGLLRGRHGFSRNNSSVVVGEARAYVEASAASHPYDEFGAPEVYAAELAAGKR